MREPSVAKPPAPTSLRERKKAHTRRRLIDTSQRLFLEQGFAETTLEQIAAEVEVNVKTLLRYFPTKPDLALGLELQLFERFSAELAGVGPAQSAVEFYCDFMHGLAVEWVSDERRADRLAYVFLLDSDPTIAARATLITQAYEDAVAEHLARERKSTSGFDMYARVVAAMVVNSMHAVTRRWAADPHELDLLAAIAAVRAFCLTEFPSRSAATHLTKPTRRTG